MVLIVYGRWWSSACAGWGRLESGDLWKAASISESRSSKRVNLVVMDCLKIHVSVGASSPWHKLTKMPIQSVRVKLTKSETSA